MMAASAVGLGSSALKITSLLRKWVASWVFLLSVLTVHIISATLQCTVSCH